MAKSMKNYVFSQQLFLDLWDKYDNKEVITDLDTIVRFLSDLIELSNGQVIVDHFSKENYDCIERIERVENYVKIIWKDFSGYLEKKAAGTLSDMEKLVWSIWDNASYVYALLNIEKIKILRIRDHIMVLFRTSPIEPRRVERLFSQGTNKILIKDQQPNLLYSDFFFLDNSGGRTALHMCTVYTLPFFVMLIQPKEHDIPSSFSHIILVRETLSEIRSRFTRTVQLLNMCDEYDTDDIASKGNTIRTLLEYMLKYYCIYKKLPLKDVDQKYCHIALGDLKKVIPEGDLSISQELINQANAFSHDSGKTFHKDDVLQLAYSFELVLNEIEHSINGDINSKYGHLLRH